MKKFKKTIGMLLAIIMVSVTMLPTTVAHAAGTMAFSVGTDYGGLFGVDTTSDATNARDLYVIAGYNSYSSTQPTVSILKGSFSTSTKRMQSDILFFSGHGNYNNVSYNYDGKGGDYATGIWYTGDCTTTDGYKMVGLSGNMSSVKLVTFAACLTASNNDNNITANAVSYGADTAVGWSSSINAGSHSNWLARYNDKLATGSTVLEAVTYANSFTYLDSDVKDARIYGNRSLKIKLTKTASVLEEEAELGNVSVSVPNIIGVVDEDSAIEAARMNIPDFCSDDYEVKIYEICKDCYTIDFVFTVDGIRTNSGYTMTVVDGVIATIVDNTIDFNADEVKTAVAQFSIGSDVAVMSAAKEETNSSQLKDATDQEVVYFYDIESGTFQKIVFTVYQFDGTDAVGKDMYIQNMN